MSTMEYFIGVRISNSAKEARVRQHTLQGMVLSRQCVTKFLDRRIKHLERSTIERSNVALAPDNIKGRPFLRARLCQQKGAARKIECSKSKLAGNLGAALFPLKPSGYHQVEDEEEFVIEFEHNLFTEPAKLDHFSAVDGRERRIH